MDQKSRRWPAAGDRTRNPDSSHALEAWLSAGADHQTAFVKVSAKAVATLNHAFEPRISAARGEPRVFLDPLGPQSKLSETFRSMLKQIVAGDRAYHQRLVRHNELWKSTVSEPARSQRAVEIRRVRGHE